MLWRFIESAQCPCIFIAHDHVVNADLDRIIWIVVKRTAFFDLFSFNWLGYRMLVSFSQDHMTGYLAANAVRTIVVSNKADCFFV